MTLLILFLWIGVFETNAQDSTWHRFVIDNSLSGADGVRLTDINNDLDVLTWEENFGPESRGLGVIWYENPGKTKMKFK
jgi:hypothetical protein